MICTCFEWYGIEKYKKFERNIKLAKNRNVRWCIKPGCDTPLLPDKQTKKTNKLICNKCKTEICFKCAQKYHPNTDCDLELDKKLEKWCLNKARDVQFCPRCNARIEKLEGCNHIEKKKKNMEIFEDKLPKIMKIFFLFFFDMNCSYCKYEFCWLCRKEYKKGHYDRTNIFGGCPGGENSLTKVNKCNAICGLISACFLTCCLPCRICCWRMQEQGFPWCLCWCCCDD